MNTLKGISINDDVAQSSTILKNEDSAVRSSVHIRVAGCPRSNSFVVAEVLGTRDGARSREGDHAANAGWDVGVSAQQRDSEECCEGSDLVLHDK